MGALPGWMPILIEKISQGCSCSPWFIDLAEEQKVLIRGRKIILDLWPFIRELPKNILAVRSAVPESMTSALQLLSRLSDSELQYQKLFLQQFDLTGVSAEEIEKQDLNPHTARLCRAMSDLCDGKSFEAGIHAIVAAELAASLLSRSSLPCYERYFEKHADKYEPELINAGLAWLRLHAKTHTRHAIWMIRMLNDLESKPSEEIPPGAQAILQAVLELWECSPSGQQLTAARLS